MDLAVAYLTWNLVSGLAGLEMSPCLGVRGGYVTDGRLRDLEHSGEFSTSHAVVAQMANGDHVVAGEPGCSNLVALGAPALSDHVFRVLAGRADPQMVGITASNSVACVHHEPIGRDGATECLVSDTRHDMVSTTEFDRSVVNSTARPGRGEDHALAFRDQPRLDESFVCVGPCHHVELLVVAGQPSASFVERCSSAAAQAECHMDLIIASGVASLTWNLVSKTLFIGLPSEGVDEVCVEDSICVVPDNRQFVVIDWDGPPPVVKARSGSSWVYALPCTPFTG